MKRQHFASKKKWWTSFPHQQSVDGTVHTAHPTIVQETIKWLFSAKVESHFSSANNSELFCFWSRVMSSATNVSSLHSECVVATIWTIFLGVHFLDVHYRINGMFVFSLERNCLHFSSSLLGVHYTIHIERVHRATCQWIVVVAKDFKFWNSWAV